MVSQIFSNIENTKGKDVVRGLFGFGERSPVRILDDTKANALTKYLVKNAVKSIDNISVIGKYNKIITPLIAKNESIKKRILLLNRESDSPGFKALASSEYEKVNTLLRHEFLQIYREWYKELKIGKNIEIRTYCTVPWFRGTIIDNKQAVFFINVNLAHGKNRLHFYTSDYSTIRTLKRIFEDIWEDTRTKSFKKYYDSFLRSK